MTAIRIPVEKFLPLYLKAAEQDMTREEFAESVGLKPSTVYQRVYEMRAAGADLPILRSAKRASMKDKVQAIIDEYNAKVKAKSKAVVRDEAPAKQEQNGEIEESDPLADILG